MVNEIALSYARSGVAVATGGLAAPMLLHAVLDLTSGQAVFLALGRTGVSDPERPPRPEGAPVA